RGQKNFEVSEEILHFAPVKEALPADQVIAHASPPQFGFEGTRLNIGAEQNRLRRPRNALRLPQKINLFDDRSRLRLFIFERVQGDSASLSPSGPEFFSPAARVVFDDRIGGAKNGVGRSVIL